MADLHSAELKSKCIDYITNNGSKVRATKQWKRLQEENRFDLLQELFTKMAIKQGC